MKEAVARAHGDLEEAERIAAEDRLQVNVVDDDEPATSTKPATKRQKKEDNDSVLLAMQQKVDAAGAELSAVREAMIAAEPVTERTTFMDWVGAVCKTASDDHWCAFQTSFLSMRARWNASNNQQQQQRQLPRGSAGPSSTPSPSPSACYQPPPQQWRVPLAQGQVRDNSVWESQSQDYMAPYMQQLYVNHTTYQQSQVHGQHQQSQPFQQQHFQQPVSVIVPVCRASENGTKAGPQTSTPATTTTTSDTLSTAIHSALFSLNDSQTSLNLSAGSLGMGLSNSTQEAVIAGNLELLNTPPAAKSSTPTYSDKTRDKFP